MLREERQQHIVDLVNEEGQATVADLADRFDVTRMTIRRDLQSLDERGKLRRTHGGAVRRRRELLEPPLFDRMQEHEGEKKRIAAAVAELIRPRETIFLGSGSTIHYVAKRLVERDDITVVTNAVTVLSEFTRYSRADLIVIGGFLRRSEYSLIGHIAEAALADLRVDKVIMGMRGIHPQYGLTSDHPQELMTDRRILEIGDEVIIVADQSKFGFTATSMTAPITRASLFVTSRDAPGDVVAAIRSKGILVKQV